MKKCMFFAAALAAVMSSCSSDENVASQSKEALQPIVLGASQMATAETRGTGTLGAIAEDENLFQFEDLYVLMTNIPEANGTWGFATSDCKVGEEATSDLGYQFDGSFICRPEESTTSTSSLNYLGAWGTNGAVKYYPSNGASDFFAYHIDDAAAGALAKDAATSTMTVDFNLNGSQDIMAGKATNYPDGQRGFTAKTARANIVPNITMKHVLSRLTFEVKSGHSNTAGVKINSIEVESANKGSLLVAYNEAGAKEAKDLVTWKTDKSWFALMQKVNPWTSTIDGGKPALIDFEDVEMEATGSKNVGEALFVKPGETAYPLKVTMTQNITTSTGAKDVTATLEETIKLPTANATFQPGYSYHVVITVYGLNDIRVNATLEAWKDGGTIEIDTAE